MKGQKVVSGAKRTVLLFLAVFVFFSSIPVSAEENKKETENTYEAVLDDSEEESPEGDLKEPETCSPEVLDEENTDREPKETVMENRKKLQEESTGELPEEGSETSPEGTPENLSEGFPEESSEENQEEMVLESYMAPEEAKEPVYQVAYQVHGQTYGWQDWTGDGEWAGTTGQKKRLEALNIKVIDVSKPDVPAETVEGAITYRTHCQTYGWQNPVADGATAGTVHQAKRLEAVEISLTGELAKEYDIYYQVHSATFGDLGWAKNGERAGSEGYEKAVEAIRIRLIKKGSSDAPKQSGRSFISPTRKGKVTYTSHVQTYGWLETVADGAVSGTQGEAKRMEAFRVYLDHPRDENGRVIPGELQYQAHSQSYGWMGWKKEGEMAGTSGQSKRLEAVRIRLTGELAEKYDIYYRVHCATWGTLGWAKNGEAAGTAGYYKSIESLEIRLFPKGEGAVLCPQDKRAALEQDKIGAITVSADVSGQGGSVTAGNGGIAGTEGSGKALEAIRIQVQSEGAFYKGSVVYKTATAADGWGGEFTGGVSSGQAGGGKGLEAVELRLTGELAAYHDIYYRVSVQGLGWLGWAKNGQVAGSSGMGASIEALQVMVQPKTAPGPGENNGYFTTKTRYDEAIDTVIRNAGTDLYSCYRWIVDNVRYQTLPIPMDPPAGFTYEQGYAIYGVENRAGNCYCYAATFAGVARRLGYQVTYIEGSVRYSDGSYGPHGWVEIVKDGAVYVCDAQAERQTGANCFMVTYGNARFRYRH